MYMHAKIDHHSFSHSGDMVGALQNVNGSRDMTTPKGMICHPWASTCYDQPIYQIWMKSLSLLTTKMRKAIKISKTGWFEVDRGHSSHWK